MCVTLEYESDATEPECFPDTEFSSDEEELFDCGDTSDIVLNQITNHDSGFFPFPSEIFFLLYSYAHNTSRPKVKIFYEHKYKTI